MDSFATTNLRLKIRANPEQMDSFATTNLRLKIRANPEQMDSFATTNLRFKIREKGVENAPENLCFPGSS
jgi:hypothetical protein